MQAAKALGPGAADEIVAYHRPSNIEMPRRLLRCLRGLDWLNDEVINIYMGMLQVCRLPSLLYSCVDTFRTLKHSGSGRDASTSRPVQ